MLTVGAHVVRASVADSTRHDGDPTAWVQPAARGSIVLIDGRPVVATLGLIGPHAANLTIDDEGAPIRLWLGIAQRREADGVVIREVVVHGWRVEVALEPERRAILREKARRSASETGAGGTMEVRAIIPGRIVALSVAPGDGVTAGQQVLVLEAMKMQNELRAPREGTIDRVAVGVGQTVELGDLLLVIR